MFVISLISDGDLIKTAIKGNANDAVEVAQEWYIKNYEDCIGGYIAIDQEVKGEKKENVRFAKITFDGEKNMQMFLDLNENKKDNLIFYSRFSQVTKLFLIHFLEYALVRISDYVADKNKRRGE